MIKNIYLDYNASTPLYKNVVNNFSEYTELFANPSSAHTLGRNARLEIETARRAISSLLKTAPEEIIFTSGGTESINTAIKGIFFQHFKKRKHIIISAIEHPSVIQTCEFLKNNFNAEISIIPVDSFGIIQINELNNIIRNDTLLVSIISVNNETGVIQPIEEAAGLIFKKNKQRISDDKLFFHLDGVQAFAKIELDIQKLNADLISFSCNKLYCPRGAGILYKKNETVINPLLHGGHQENNLRAGTENIFSIISAAKILPILYEESKSENIRQTKLRDKLFNGLKDNINDIYLNGHPQLRISNTLNISFSGIKNEVLITKLDLAGIAVSAGAACAAGAYKQSQTLKAMGLSNELINSAIRFSLGIYTTENEIDKTIKLVSETVNDLKKLTINNYRIR